MLTNALSQLTYYRTYARWNDRLSRREQWPETVDRYMAFMRSIVGGRLDYDEYANIREHILLLKVMPSMRLLWSAGPAAESNQIAAYNCAYLAPTHYTDLSDIMYLLMCGVGVGFSVESKVIGRWPEVRPQSDEAIPVHNIQDSREGWANSLREGLSAWMGGRDIGFDFSAIRPRGERIRTLGGRTSGPEPLRECLSFARRVVLENQGRRLSSLSIHDIICKIGEAISQGGVRRSALISLSDLNDDAIRDCKRGEFYLQHRHRSMANNSTVYEEKPSWQAFQREWHQLESAGTGERGIFNRADIPAQIPERRRPYFNNEEAGLCGTNPCGEIILRSKQFCNLTEVIARPEDDKASLSQKVRMASLLGTFQSMLCHFPFVDTSWTTHCEEERLLGVSISGLWDSTAARDRDTLIELRRCAVETNAVFARRLGILPSTAVTCIKPSGTVSQLVDCASGMHPRYAPFYIRRVRIAMTDPLFRLMKDQGVPNESEDSYTSVLEFPVASPKGSIFLQDLSVLDQLEHWLLVKKAFTEHNPSVTISVGPQEWETVAFWVYGHWQDIGGLSFLPREGAVYRLAPFEAITADEYAQRASRFPRLDFSRLTQYESDDQTLGSREFNCVGNACEWDPEEGTTPITPPSSSAP